MRFSLERAAHRLMKVLSGCKYERLTHQCWVNQVVAAGGPDKTVLDQKGMENVSLVWAEPLSTVPFHVVVLHQNLKQQNVNH